MKKHYWKFGLMFVLFAGMVVLTGAVVMGLWNAVMPSVFGLGVITFGQALALLLLARILMGGFGRWGRGGCYGGGHWKHRFRERWNNMTPEEREKMKEKFFSYCGRHPKNEVQPGSETN